MSEQTMVERVARALVLHQASQATPKERQGLTPDQIAEHGWEPCSSLARAAIVAMRDGVTPGMCMAGLKANSVISSDTIAGDPARWMRPTWFAMIDAALSEIEA